MNQNIITHRLRRPEVAPSGQRNVDDYRSRIIKLIPAEIIAAYLTLKGLIESAASSTSVKEIIYWIVFLVLLVLTPIYYKKITKVVSGKQLFITTCAFILWVYSVGGPMADWFVERGIFTESDQSLIASVLLILFTLISPLLFVPTEELQVDPA